jgi:hypothetical protein
MLHTHHLIEIEWGNRVDQFLLVGTEHDNTYEGNITRIGSFGLLL